MAAIRKYVSPPVPLPSPEQIRAASGAVIEFSGVDQAGPSFEARVFLNNPAADPATPTTPEHGYAGSFHVYGYGLWSGKAGEPQPGSAPAAAAAPIEQPPPAGAARLPMRRVVQGPATTDAVLRAAAQGPTATVTVAPVVPGGAPGQADDLGAVLTIDGVRVTVKSVKPDSGAGEGGRRPEAP